MQYHNHTIITHDSEAPGARGNPGSRSQEGAQGRRGEEVGLSLVQGRKCPEIRIQEVRRPGSPKLQWGVVNCDRGPRPMTHDAVAPGSDQRRDQGPEEAW